MSNTIKKSQLKEIIKNGSTTVTLDEIGEVDLVTGYEPASDRPYLVIDKDVVKALKVGEKIVFYILIKDKPYEGKIDVTKG